MSSSNSQSDFSPKVFTKQNSQNSQYSFNNNINNKKENQLITIRKLYPKFSDDIYEENNVTTNKNTLVVKNEMAFKRNHGSFLFDDEEENKNGLSEGFLLNLIKRPCPLNKNKIISVMSKFIQTTSLIQKIQKEFQSDKKLDINELSIMCAEILNYIELKKGKVLFRIGDIGDRFYFILSGKICILKLKEIKNIQMNCYEYIDYCMFLIREKESYIFNEVLKKNENILRINSESEVRAIYKIIIMRKLKRRLFQQLLHNTKALIKYLEKMGCKPEDIDIKVEELEKIENNKTLKNKDKEKEWNEYILKQCKPSFNDLVLFEPYESKIDREEKYSVTCFCYEPFLFLGKGLFFGDFALDSEINKRNATIRAEEDTILGFLKSVDYINIFAPKRKIEKLKEMTFLYNNYFFGNINSRVFEKNYFHLFSPREYIRNNVLFIFGSNPKSLILLKEGKVSLELKASIIDLHNLIKYLWENIHLSKWYKKLNSNLRKELIPNYLENKIKEYIDEPIFTSLKVYGEQFIQEMNKIKTYQISMLTNNEIIGLEEIYLNIPYIMKGTVNDNRIYCYEITVEHINKFLAEEKQILYPFVKSSINKIISLIERLQNFKTNGVNMAKNKYEKDNSNFNKKHENNKNNNNKINEVTNRDKERTIVRYKNKNKNNEENKTISKNFSCMNIFNDKDNNKNMNVEKSLRINKIINKRYKSPVRIISTNLMPVIKIISSRQQQKINRKENLINDDNLNIIQNNDDNNNDNNISKNDCELNNDINENNSINNDLNSVECSNKNNISHSASTDAIPSSSDNNIISPIFKSNKTINELKKQLENINVIEFENHEVLNLNKGYISSKRSYSYNNLINNDKNIKIKNVKKHSLLKHQSKLGNFHLSYVPLNVLSPKGRYLQRSHSSLINDKDNTSASKSHSNKKKIFNFGNLYSKKSKKDTDEEKEKDKEKQEKINNIWYGIKTNGIKNINNVDINKELSKYMAKNKNNEKKYTNIRNINLMNKEEIKKRISPDVIKNFYNEIKKRGYSSFIHNKENNTIFTRKYRRKYGTNNSQVITPQNKIDSNRNSTILPIINEKNNNIIISDKGL